MDPYLPLNLPESSQSLLVVINIVFIIGLLFYIVFASVIIRQVQMMLQSLNGVLNLPIRLVAWLHLAIAVLLLLLSIIWL